MKRILMTTALAGLFAVGTCAVAQDQTHQGDQTQQTSQTMKECMSRQKATNSGLTHMQMQTTCKNEMKGNKTRKEGNDLATGSQAGDKQPQE